MSKGDRRLHGAGRGEGRIRTSDAGTNTGEADVFQEKTAALSRSATSPGGAPLIGTKPRIPPGSQPARTFAY